ncbi:MAG: RdgB/HAM1 family non-canonical purine NTP pyrophosphatase [Nevskia sp.]
MGDLVLASQNPKKLAELEALLAALGYRLRLVSEFSAVEPEESAPSFVENALIKARHAARVSGLPAIADDSGLEVEALQGAPGVHSARYAGEGAGFASTARAVPERRGMDGPAGDAPKHSRLAMDGLTQAARDEANNAKLLAELAGVPDAHRGARFVSVLVLLRHAADPVPVIAQGCWPGRILQAPRGTRGFGYDPLFLDPETGLSAAEFEPAEKNRRSHRARAVQALLAALR